MADIFGTIGDDSINGTPFDDLVFASAGNDTILAGDGFDQIEGGTGNDIIDGGDGTDFANYSGATSGLLVNLNIAAPQNVGGGQGTDTLISISGINGSNHNDTLIGDAGVNNLFGGTGDNSLNGGSGDDAQLDGHSGNDTINGGDGSDMVTYADTTPAGGVTVDLRIAGPQNVGGGFGTDTLISIERISGTILNDTLIGDDADNAFRGRAGDDILDGGNGSDTATYSLAGLSVTVDLRIAGPQFISASEGMDTLISIENVVGSVSADTLIGNDGQNNLRGGSGNDSLDGGQGNDSLTGGNDNDTMIGGRGADTLSGATGDDSMNGGFGDDVFVFVAAFGNDVIDGFDANPGGGQDLLDISAIGVTAANFGAHVTIVDLGADTLVTIDGTDTITLLGVSGRGRDVITQSDFILA